MSAWDINESSGNLTKLHLLYIEITVVPCLSYCFLAVSDRVNYNLLYNPSLDKLHRTETSQPFGHRGPGEHGFARYLDPTRADEASFA